MAGLPGTGLGGVFYALLILWMAVREVRPLAHGESSRARWKTITTFSVLLTVIVIVLGAEFWIIQYITRYWIRLDAASGDDAVYDHFKALAPTLALAPFVILGTMLILLHLARRLLAPVSASQQR